MAKKTKSINDLSAAELYELARRREMEERQREMEANKEKLKELRAKRRKLISEHKKAIAQLDAEIARLSGRAPSKRGRTNASTGISELVIDIIGSKGKASTSDIRAALAERGVTASNLPQTLSYLKRKGRIVSPERTIYQLAQ